MSSRSCASPRRAPQPANAGGTGAPHRRALGRAAAALTAAATVVALSSATSVASAQQTASQQSGPGGAQQIANATGHHSHAACAPAPIGAATCLAKVVDHGAKDVTPLASPAPYGNSPAKIKGYYGFPTSLSAGAGSTIALVDAYDDPTAAGDLATFSTTYGLPCNACFTKVNQSGGTGYPAVNNSWAVEISLDVQWAHAIAPGANIVLVETASNNLSDLDAGVAYAKAHAQYVSLSWGGAEFSTESSLDSTFAAPGVSVFASAGDSGLPAQYPSASPNVISVGGTSLSGLGGNTPVTETAWPAGGGGCSAYEPATAAQATFSQYAQVSCGGQRATPDVALDADPTSGVSIVDSTTNSASTPWMMVGGTSASAPMWAGRSAVEGGVMNSARVYGTTNPPPFHDVTSGNNGAPALVGYDLATGRGSWVDGATPPPSGNDFSLSANPASVSLAAGASASAAIATTVTSGSSSSVTLSDSVSPGGPSVTLSPASVMSGGSSSASLVASAVPGTYSVTVTGTNGTMTHSTTVMVTVQSSQPAVPGAAVLSVQAASPRGVTLSWAAPSGSPTSYTVYRGRAAGAESSYTTVDCSASTCSFTDTGTKRSSRYYYEITATNAAGTGPLSNEASTVTR